MYHLIIIYMKLQVLMSVYFLESQPHKIHINQYYFTLLKPSYKTNNLLNLYYYIS